MKPGSTDGILTLLASFLMAALLFVGRTVIESRGPSWIPRERDRTASAPNPTPQNDTTAGKPGIDWSQSSPTDAAQQPAFPGGTTTVSRGSEPPGAVTSQNSGTFKVVGVVDGDTIDVLVNNSPLRLRLNGVDTPEKGQPFGNNAKDDLADLIGGKQVKYVVRDSDRYGRSIADVYLGNLYVNLWLVQQGLAWHYVAYSDDTVIAAAEAEARAAGRGLWSDPRKVAPWNWRKLSKLERDEFR